MSNLGPMESRRLQMFPVLDARDFERLRRFGDIRAYKAGDYIVKAGEAAPGLLFLIGVPGSADVPRLENFLTCNGPPHKTLDAGSDRCALILQDRFKIAPEMLPIGLCPGGQSPRNPGENRHATKHFHRTKHPIIEGYDPPEGWGWCCVDEVPFDLSGRATLRDGPIPRHY